MESRAISHESLALDPETARKLVIGAKVLATLGSAYYLWQNAPTIVDIQQVSATILDGTLGETKDRIILDNIYAFLSDPMALASMAWIAKQTSDSSAALQGYATLAGISAMPALGLAVPYVNAIEVFLVNALLQGGQKSLYETAGDILSFSQSGINTMLTFTAAAGARKAYDYVSSFGLFGRTSGQESSQPAAESEKGLQPS